MQEDSQGQSPDDRGDSGGVAPDPDPQRWVRAIIEETGASPEPSGYARWQSWRHRVHEERDALTAGGSDPEYAERRAVEIADAAREAALRERALGRFCKVDDLDCEARRLNDESIARVRASTGVDAMLAVLDEAIVLHWRIAHILSLTREAFDGSVYARTARGSGSED